ncbi:IS701 family transposase [Nonomuraea diastatica]|uniref:IS701 family transposase n=1 Tax=Nonomuraea diastatica TaxID=1848329 RepID=UPI001C7058C0|nr:IS701 family transposase [Nonomuraea diastatica]
MTFVLTYDLVVSWDADLAALIERIAGPLFTRPEPRATFADLVRGLMADVPRKNSWQLADHVGHKNAYRFEWLLNGAKWDADRLRDEVRSYVIEHLGSPDGVLIADDTQAIKKGDKSVGVAPQHCGATGQIENCQVLPMLTYASDTGHAFINRRLYLPACWTDDPVRMKAAGVPEAVGFTTKPHQVIDMVEDEIAAGTPFRYFTADSGYGRDPALRAFFHRRGLRYVVAVPVDLPLIDARGRATRPDKVFKDLGVAQWERRSCGDGSKGKRVYDWGMWQVTVKDQSPTEGFGHTLLIRRSISDLDDIEFFLAHAPAGTPAPELITIAGMRWKIEEDNEHGKDLLGLNEYQVRRWTPWYRHVTTCMLALAFLAVARAQLPDQPATDKPHATGTDQGKAPALQERAR